MINVDDVHFLSAKNKSIFKIKTKVGPYVFNARTAGIEAELLLKKINFKPNFTWFYDTLGHISKMRIEKKYTPYSHTPRPEIEQYKNQTLWVENTVQEEEEKNVQSTVSQTQTPQEKTEKRTRERSPETDNPAKEFLIYRNKQKTLSNPEYQQRTHFRPPSSKQGHLSI